MKVQIEINFCDPEQKFTKGAIFLNYWDWAHGNDVVCELVDGKLMRSMHDENGDDLPSQEITFVEFIEAVKESISKIDPKHLT